MGRPFFTSIRHSSRPWSPFRYRVIFTILILGLLQQQRLFFLHRQSLAAKYSQTIFDSNPHELHPRLLRPDDEDSHFQEELLANRVAWKMLGEGWEGKVYVYNASVIKTFTPGRSPFRNCAPGTTNQKWPTEIPASLYFGGFFRDSDRHDHEYRYNASTSVDGFLPVKAYFMTSPRPPQQPEWHLISPLVPGGNLNTMAHRLSRETTNRSFRDIDALYRPAFHRLLESIEELHNAGYCHDDIKPANIFIQEESHWVLGDLGNVRHISHPYHSSSLWRDNQQLEDCRANDVIRALKSYIKFIQNSQYAEESFNTAFFELKEPLSRLFWWAFSDATVMSAAKLRRLSVVEYPESPPRTDADDGFRAASQSLTLMRILHPRLALKHDVDRILATRMGEKMARWWAMTWLFGVPVADVCEV